MLLNSRQSCILTPNLKPQTQDYLTLNLVNQVDVFPSVLRSQQLVRRAGGKTHELPPSVQWTGSPTPPLLPLQRSTKSSRFSPELEEQNVLLLQLLFCILSVVCFQVVTLSRTIFSVVTFVVSRRVQLLHHSLALPSSFH